MPNPGRHSKYPGPGIRLTPPPDKKQRDADAKAKRVKASRQQAARRAKKK